MMSGIKRAIFGAVLAGVAASVQAGDLSTSVSGSTPVSLSINDSKPAATYTVTVTNVHRSASMKTVWFRATANVTDTAGVIVQGAVAPYKTASVPCTSGVGGLANSVTCTVVDAADARLRPDESRTFTVTFTAPTSGEMLALAWESGFNMDDGSGGNSNGAGDKGTNTETVLKAIDKNNVVSDIPVGTDVVTMFTGQGVATDEDTWVTRVDVPGSAVATRATILELVESGSVGGTCAQASNLLNCSATTLTIPGATFSGPFLEITLLRDASTLAKGAKIASAKVVYRKEPDASGSCGALSCSSYPMDLLSCSNKSTYGDLPQPGIPCIKEQQEFAKKSTGKVFVPPGYEGDWRFLIWAVDNGRFEN
jgi:hypothetical protein